MSLTLSQRIQQIFLGREFTLDGERIVTEREGECVRKFVPSTGERVYEATGSMRWFGPNYVAYCLFNS